MATTDFSMAQVLFGQRVRRRRLALAISQERLAALAGIHRTYIGSVERGERNVALVNIVRIAGALGIDPADLLRGLAPPPRERKHRPA